MNKNKKTQGTTFLEIVLCVGIIFVISTFSVFKITKNNEQLDLERSRKIFQSTVFKYVNKSINRRERYIIEMKLLEKKILVKEIDNIKIIEEIDLPLKLKYEILYDKKRSSKFIFQTTPTGNLSKSFTIYTFGYSNKVENRIAFYIYQKEQLLKINTYLNRNLKNVNYDNILEYHYSPDGQNRLGWEEEE